MTKDMLSQEEIDSLLKGTEDINEDYVENDVVSEIEKDTIGEIGNISMGTAATTLSTLLNRKVIITTPTVTVTTTGELSYEYPIPFVAVDVKYREGFEGSNVLMINVDDVKIITDIMLGNNEIDTDRELTELDLSAISEVMNQMMGSACTSLSEIFMKKIDIEPPKSYEITFDEGRETLEVLKSSDPIIKVSFKMIVDDLIDSELMQLIPLEFGQDMVENLLGDTSQDQDVETANSMDYEDEYNLDSPNNLVEKGIDSYNATIEETPIREKEFDKDKKDPVVIKKPQFETFDTDVDVSYNESIDLVGDIPVEITAELGRTTKKIGEILEYGPGTVVELDKLVGEPLNIYANGKYIAKGEVVVIDDNFGIRITDIDNSYGK
ncbi:flagellar motor switch phosphatase FliY [Clostridium sp. Cult3]|uniref:flagellar motor switch phosphatase FliY n=1 Tax=Clostridium sp. Cult3 TaxID=2079004 RepID=UPI001F00C7FC|nr:flagellar motor switch phosphatase FliY [Clostridium sp. Cult3]MCF6460535.1 flagellar motor switch phosphatase FliY [Clostridium sp. Cult3]